MAFPIRNYARALYEASIGKTKAEVAELVVRTLTIMKEKSSLSKTAALIAEVERLDDIASDRLRASVESAHRLDDDMIEKLEKVLHHRTGAKEIIWEKHVDKALLGGVIVRYGDTILDMSLVSRVQALKETISN